MEKINIRYYKKKIRVWLFKATLLLSVFAFSGFNIQAQSASNQSVNTELVVSRTAQSNYHLKRVYKKYCNLRLAISPLIDNSFNVWALLRYNNVLKNKFKQYKKRTLHSCFDSVKLFFKIPLPSSEDKPFHYS